MGEQQLIWLAQATGQCFVIHTKLGDQLVVRFACGGIEQTEQDVTEAWQVIASEADKLGL